MRTTDAPDLGLLTLAYKVGLADEVFAIVEMASFDSILSEDGPSPAGALSPGVIFDRTTGRELIEDPRFPRLCAKLRLCGYWCATNRWPDCAAYVSYDFKAESRRLA